MNEKGKGLSAPKRLFPIVVVLLNIVLLACAVVLYSRYTAVYQDRLREENLGNIANLNRSAAANATALVNSWNNKLDDITQYVSRHDMSYAQLLSMLNDTNSAENLEFQLIGSDYTGHLARRDAALNFIPVSYAGSSYSELQQVLNDTADTARGSLCFAPEFTDSVTALKYFAIYRHLTPQDAQGAPQTYTLLLATKSRDVLSAFNNQSGFEGQFSVLVDAKGNYIVSSNDFKSANFFQFLYVYNDLTLDQRNGIQQEIAENGTGELYYKNAADRDCVFCYVKMSTSDWYCITSVPVSSFRTPVFTVNYAVYAVLMLLIMLVVDVFWLQRMNRRLRMSMLREKEASEAKTVFLSRMSHDIRTPLNGIIGLTALAQDEPNPPHTQEYLENIKVSGQFLSGLVNDILDMSKVESGKVELHPEPYSSQDLCKYAEAIVLPLCREKRLEFRMSPPGDNSRILLDRLRFNQIVFNLLSNAVKYTPEGGTVELLWEKTDLPGGRAALSFTVRDNGIGMSEEFQRHMFESFSQEQAQTATTGSGLGLAIVHSLVKLMNGSINVISRQNEGSAFTVHLETDVCAPEEDAPVDAGEAELSGRRVLLCEDNRINVLFIRRLLEKWEITVDSAENGRVGVETFAASAPGTYDAILMDVMMPEMNGIEAARAIRSLAHPDSAAVPIIAMTANAYDIDVTNCLDAGMTAHMGKPIEPEKLRALLAKLLT